ncbi:MAG: GntR family transcriptional regulator [Marinobacter sp.]|nr:GntR family transcriptional regulator [Marinobacter sp.]
MTIRRAVDALVAEGLVERRHGSGNHVTPQPFVRLLALYLVLQDMRRTRPLSRARGLLRLPGRRR